MMRSIALLAASSNKLRISVFTYYQAEQICSIGSGAIESTVKQIDEVNAAFGACIRKNVDRRTKISGAQWKIENQIIIYLIPTTYYPTPISYF